MPRRATDLLSSRIFEPGSTSSEVAENQSDTLEHFGAPPQNEREFVAAPGNALVSKERAASCDRKVTNTPVNACKAIRFTDGRKNRKNTIGLYELFTRNCNDSHRDRLQRVCYCEILERI